MVRHVPRNTAHLGIWEEEGTRAKPSHERPKSPQPHLQTGTDCQLVSPKHRDKRALGTRLWRGPYPAQAQVKRLRRESFSPRSILNSRGHRCRISGTDTAQKDISTGSGHVNYDSATLSRTHTSHTTTMGPSHDAKAHDAKAQALSVCRSAFTIV